MPCQLWAVGAETWSESQGAPGRRCAAAVRALPIHPWHIYSFVVPIELTALLRPFLNHGGAGCA
jgi:hypothetical protein